LCFLCCVCVCVCFFCVALVFKMIFLLLPCANKYMMMMIMMSWLTRDSGQNSFTRVTSVDDWWTWSQGPLLQLLSTDDHHSLVCHAVMLDAFNL